MLELYSNLLDVVLGGLLELVNVGVVKLLVEFFDFERYCVVGVLGIGFIYLIVKLGVLKGVFDMYIGVLV